MPDAVISMPGGIKSIYAGGLKFPSGELGHAGRTFDGAVNIEVEGFNGTLPGSLMRFHDSHQRPYLWSQKLKEAINFNWDFQSLKQSIEPVKRDKVRIAPANIKSTP